MNAKSIVFVNRFFYPDHSATAQIVSDLAFVLARQNYSVKVLTTQGLYHSADASLATHEICGGVEILRVYRPRFGREGLYGRALDYFLMYLVFSKALFSVARRGDIVIAKTDPPLLSVALLPVVLIRGAKLINWLQDLYPEVAVAFGMRTLAPISPFLGFMRGLSLKKALRNVVIGSRMESFVVRLGVPAEQVSVIPNWCTQEEIRPLDQDEHPLRREWGLGGKFVVAYSGNLGRAHETATLLDAAERLKEEEGLIFLFIGGGALSAPLRAEVDRRGLGALFMFEPYQPSDRLRFTLTLPDVFWVSLRPEMEGLIVPSKFYGNCAAGRATIFVGDPEGEIGRLVEEHDCGLSVSVGDSVRLAEAILRLKNDRPRLEAMGRNARRASDETLSRTASLDAWERLVAAEIGRPGAAPQDGASRK